MFRSDLNEIVVRLTSSASHLEYFRLQNRKEVNIKTNPSHNSNNTNSKKKKGKEVSSKEKI